MEILNNIPTCWRNVRLDQYLELNNIVVDDYDSLTSIQLEKISILTDTSSDDEIWDEVDIDELSKIYNTISFLNTTPTLSNPEFLLNNTFIVIKSTKITVGEFIDLESYIEDGVDKNISKIAATLIRKYKVGEWGEIIIEPYSAVNLDNRIEDIMECGTEDIYSIVMNYINFRNRVFEAYKNLFEPDIPDETDEVELTEEELEEIQQIEKDEAKLRKWNWERFLYSISGGDLIKAKEMLNMGLLYVFNMLSMKQELRLD